MEAVVFWVFAVISVGGALIMVWSRNTVHSALGLMATLFSVAVLYVVNEGHFLAAAQVLVYAGAVMTLFLFVIMLIGVDRMEDRTDALRGQRSLGLAVSAGFAIVLLAVGSSAWITGAVAGPEPVGTAEAIADRLFNEWVLPFELTGILLIIAAVGTIALGFYKPTLRDPSTSTQTPTQTQTETQTQTGTETQTQTGTLAPTEPSNEENSS